MKKKIIKRHCSILKSIDNGLKDIINHKKQKNLKSLEDSKKLWDKWSKDNI